METLHRLGKPGEKIFPWLFAEMISRKLGMPNVNATLAEGDVIHAQSEHIAGGVGITLTRYHESIAIEEHAYTKVSLQRPSLRRCVIGNPSENTLLAWNEFGVFNGENIIGDLVTNALGSGNIFSRIQHFVRRLAATPAL